MDKKTKPVTEGLTPDQQVACEVAASMELPGHYDGLMSSILANLTGDPPWPNSAVSAAMKEALGDEGIPTILVG